GGRGSDADQEGEKEDEDGPRGVQAQSNVDVTSGGGLSCRRPDPHGTAHAGAAMAAIAVGVLRQVLLMVVLGEIELGSGRQLRGDRAVAGGAEGLLICLQRRLRGLPLLLAQGVDRRAILRS